MPEAQLQGRNTTVLFVTGTLTTLLGMFILGHRLGFAEIFLGAHSLFGMPLTSGDALKVVVVALSSSVLIVMGLVILVAGVVVFSKSPGRFGGAPSASSQR